MLRLYAHPFSSYSQKVVIAFYESDIPFELRSLDGDAEAAQALRALWPIGKFPVLEAGERVIPESSAIIEYLHVHHAPDGALIPADADAAIEVRMMDRVFDNHVMTPMQKIVGDALRHRREQDLLGVEQAQAALDTAYDWLNRRMMSRDWACGETFTMADCAAAPALFYADWAWPIDGRFAHLGAYRKRLLNRPSVARAVDEARPYRHLFPLGAPNRD